MVAFIATVQTIQGKTRATTDVAVAVNATTTYQTIEGFGATIVTSRRGLASLILAEPNSDNITTMRISSRKRAKIEQTQVFPNNVSLNLRLNELYLLFECLIFR